MPAGANIWRVTAAGRTAIMDAANRGTNAVRFTTMVIGAGSGPGGAADDARVALRQPSGAAVNVGGSTMVQGRVALQATFTRNAEVEVTEVGLFARIGVGAEFLAAYWTDGGRVAATVVAAQPTTLAGVVDLQAAAADVDVTLAPALTLLPPTRTLLDLLDTPAAFLSGRFWRTNADGDAVVQETPAGTLSALLGGLAADRYLRTVVNGGVRGFEGRTLEQLAQDLMGLAITLRTFTASSVLVANAFPRRWIVAAWGAGGGGGAVYTADYGDLGAEIPDATLGACTGRSGGETRLSGGGFAVVADGGAGGVRGVIRSAGAAAVPVSAPVPGAVAAGSVTGNNAAGVVVPGAGASGGLSGRQAGYRWGIDPPDPGSPGALVLALATPVPGGQYAVTVGAAGAGGQTNNSNLMRDGALGGGGGVAVIEFIP